MIPHIVTTERAFKHGEGWRTRAICHTTGCTYRGGWGSTKDAEWDREKHRIQTARWAAFDHHVNGGD